MYADSDFNQYCGLEMLGFRDGCYVVRLKAESRHHNMMGFVHGGVISTLLDTAMARAFFFSLPEKERGGATLEMKINFLKSCRDGLITARGRLINQTRRTAYVEGWVEDESGRLLAKGSATVIRFQDRQGESSRKETTS